MSSSLRTGPSNHESSARPSAFAKATADRRRSAKRGGGSTGSGRAIRAIPFLIGALLCASCAARLMKLPAGPGRPASDARDAVSDATSTCRAVSTITAEIAAAGSVGGQRFRARLSAGLASPASARLEAAAPFGAPMFILVANGNDATLLLPHDGRVL